MKKNKLYNKLKRILVSIMCITTLVFTMPVKSDAYGIDDFLDLILCLPDGVMYCLNKWISNKTFDETTEEINVSGWDRKGRLPDFLVTPYEVFCSGNIDENGEVILPLLDANFFGVKAGIDSDSADILRPVVANTYNSLSTLVIILMMLVLLYIGIRIILATASTDQVRYKNMLMDWLVAICLLFCMHYIMSFIMYFNSIAINILAEKSVVSDSYYIGLSKGGSGGFKYDKNKGWSNDGKKEFVKRHLIYPAAEISNDNTFNIGEDGSFSKGYAPKFGNFSTYTETKSGIESFIKLGNLTTYTMISLISPSNKPKAPVSPGNGNYEDTNKGVTTTTTTTTTTDGNNTKNGSSEKNSGGITVNGEQRDYTIRSEDSNKISLNFGEDITENVYSNPGETISVPIYAKGDLNTNKISISATNNGTSIMDGVIASMKMNWSIGSSGDSGNYNKENSKFSAVYSGSGKIINSGTKIGDLIISIKDFDSSGTAELQYCQMNINLTINDNITAAKSLIIGIGDLTKYNIEKQKGEEDNERQQDKIAFSEVAGGKLKASIGKDITTIYRCNLVEYVRTITTFDHENVIFYSNGKSIKDESGTGSTVQNFGYAILYVIIVIETVVFVIKYMGRVINLAFLTAIAPLISFMYPIDRIGDQKAQTFNKWFKDYLFKALLQPLDLLLYTIFIYGAYQLMDVSIVYAIGMYAFMLIAEKYFKKLFGFENTAAGGGGLGSPLAGAMAMRGLDRLSNTGPGSKKSGGASNGGGSESTPTKISIPKRKFGEPMPSNDSSNTPKGSGVRGIIQGMKNNNANAIKGSKNQPNNTGGLGKSKLGASLGALGKTAGRRLSGAITGGKYDNFKGQKLKFMKATAGNVAKKVGKGALRTGGKIGGAVIGAGAGLLAGSIATAVTGDAKYLSQGVETGAFSGLNRGGQFVDRKMQQASDFADEVSAWRATKDPEYRDKVLTEKQLDKYKNDLAQVSDPKARAKYEQTIKEVAPYVKDFDSFDQIKALSNRRDDYIIKEKDENGNETTKIDYDAFEDVINTSKDVNRFNLDTEDGQKQLRKNISRDLESKGYTGDELINKTDERYNRRVAFYSDLKG